MKYKVVTEFNELEVWATGFHGVLGKVIAQARIDNGYYHQYMNEKDKGKKLIVVEDN